MITTKNPDDYEALHKKLTLEQVHVKYYGNKKPFSSSNLIFKQASFSGVIKL
jgi:hypothetical protein